MAAIALTPAEVAALRPCSDRSHLFGRRKKMNARQALEAGASIADLLWVADKLGRKDLCVRFALACAQRVAHMNPDPRVQAALDATARWLDDPTPENYAARAAARAAAGAAARAAAGAAAWAAAWAAAGAAARAAAGAAARAAAWAAAGAAAWAAAGDAAGDAARAAAWDAAGDAVRAAARAAAWAAAGDAELDEQRRIFLEIFG